MSTSSTPVGVERFARVYTDGPEELPAQADTYRDGDGGYYFKLHLDDVAAEEATPLVQKAAEEFDVELVERMHHGDVYKERVYIEDASEAPPDKKVHTGPNGGLYYESGVQRVGGDEGDQRNVAVIHWEDVEEGDDIVYETPDGSETFAEIVSIEERGDRADVIHVSIDGESQRAMPGTYTVDKSEGVYAPIRLEKAWVPYTGPQGGDGWRNRKTGEIRYQEHSPATEEGQEEEPDAPSPSDPPDGGLADGWAEPPTFTQNLEEGQAVEFHDDEQYNYGEVVDYEDLSDGAITVETETGATSVIARDDITAVEDMSDGEHGQEGNVDLQPEGSEKSLTKNEDVWTYYYGPDGGEGWMNMMTGEIRYQKQRPGEAPEGGDGYDDWLGEGWEEPPEDILDLESGQLVEFRTPDGEYHEGTVDIIDTAEGEYAQVDGGFQEPNGLVGPSGDDELTAVEGLESSSFAWEDGDHVHIRTSHLEEDHPDYEDYTGTVETTLYEGEPLYRVIDDNGTVVDEYYQEEMEELVVEDDLPEGSVVNIEWTEDHTDDTPVAEVEYTDGELGFRIQEGAYEGAWVHEDEVENIDDLLSSGGDADPDDDPDDSVPAEEQEFLDEQGLDVGDEFLYEGKEVIVTGGDSMMQDGSISHVEVYVPDADTHLPLSPNSIPDDVKDGVLDEDPEEESGDILDEIEEEMESFAEDSGLTEDDDEADPTTPDEDEMDDAVAQPAQSDPDGDESDGEYDPTEYDPSDAVGDKGMDTIGASHGNSVSAKHVVEVPGGNEMVHTDLSHSTIELDDGKRQMAGYHAMKHLDDNTLDHSAKLTEDGWFANEVAPGVDAKNASQEHKQAVSAQEFHRKAAIQTIIGNADAHQNNVRVDEDGELYFFDLDRAAGDVNGSWVGKLNYDDTLDRILGEMEKAATALGVPLDRQAVIDHAEDIAQDLDGDTVQAIRNDAADVDEGFGDAIASNIIAFQNGEVSP